MWLYGVFKSTYRRDTMKHGNDTRIMEQNYHSDMYKDEDTGQTVHYGSNRYFATTKLIKMSQGDFGTIIIIWTLGIHDDVTKWKHFARYFPFVWGIHRSPVNSPHKGQWRGALMFYLICAWINRWVNTREAGDLRRHRAHHDVIVKKF